MDNIIGNYNYKNLPAFTENELSIDTWNEKRKNEILEMFKSEEYGRIYDEESIITNYRVAETSTSYDYMEGRAIRKIVEVIAKHGEREHIFSFVLFIPKIAESKSVPVILTLNIQSCYEDTDPARRYRSGYWPAEKIIESGYAAAAVVTHNIAPDYKESFTTGFHRLFPEFAHNRKDDAYGTIAAWAWGMSKVIDHLAADPLIDSGRIAIAGHSRGGKTALWCAAQDSRVSLVLASGSGCSGAGITRGKTGERINFISDYFDYWFCKNYQKYRDKEDTMPFDQHLLLALLAPRPLCLSTKTLDDWADPRAEYESLKEASKVYRLYDPLCELPDAMPAADSGVIAGKLGFFYITGEHALDARDWDNYLEFCSKHF